MFWILKNLKLNTHIHIGTVEILEKNILYFELYKKDKFFSLYTSINLFFPVTQNTTQFLPKLRTSIQDMCMYSWNKFAYFFWYIEIQFSNTLETGSSSAHVHQICFQINPT
jgi:hypothetical protein